jgi:hypothetical protein
MIFIASRGTDGKIKRRTCTGEDILRSGGPIGNPLRKASLVDFYEINYLGEVTCTPGLLASKEQYQNADH